MHSLAVVCLTAPILAQPPIPVPEPAGLLLKSQVLDVESGRKHSLGLRGYLRGAEPLGPDVYRVQERTIDTRQKVHLAYRSGRLDCRALDGESMWARKLLLRKHAPLRTAEDRVLVHTGNGRVLGLELRTGKTTWQTARVDRMLTTGHGLMLTVSEGRVGEKKVHEVRAFATKNGAPACRVTVSGPVLHASIAPHGFAISTQGRFTVYDRFGPKLFTLAKSVRLATANKNRWFVRFGDQVRCIDRNGKTLWESKIRDGGSDQCRLIALPDGALGVASYCNISDSGAKCVVLDAGDGSVRWSREIPGLLVDHSKYAHTVYARARGEHLDLVSQGSAGSFAVALDTATGKSQQRIEIR